MAKTAKTEKPSAMKEYVALVKEQADQELAAALGAGTERYSSIPATTKALYSVNMNLRQLEVMRGLAKVDGVSIQSLMRDAVSVYLNHRAAQAAKPKKPKA